LRGFEVTSLLLSCAAVADSSYHIGNSLTWDMYMPALQQIAANFGESLTPGYHIRASKSLVFMLNNPSDVTIASPSIWPSALPGQQWSFVSFEPYPDPDTPSTLQTDITAAQTFIALVSKPSSPTTVFFIYEAWPDQNAFLGDYDAYWHQSIPNNLDQKTLLARQYFDALFQRLNVQYGNAVTLRVIPIGDVLARINELILAGQFPGAGNITDFYRDTYHMGSAGRFMAAITAFATMYGRNPSGAPYAAYLQFNDGKVILTSQMAAQLESIVWDVVTSNSARTGVDPIRISPTSLSFQSTRVGTSSQSQTIVISNIGAQPIALGTISASPNYGVTTACGESLLANTQCSVSVAFAPTVSGALSGQLGIDSAGAQHTVALSGSAPVTATISASVSTATIGQPLTLTWNASPGATCEAQSSGANSRWSGSVATSGTQTFTESVPGAFSYSLSCSATGVSDASATASVSWSSPPPAASAPPVQNLAPKSGGGGAMDLASLLTAAAILCYGRCSTARNRRCRCH
jgi:hypothetical protein